MPPMQLAPSTAIAHAIATTQPSAPRAARRGGGDGGKRAAGTGAPGIVLVASRSVGTMPLGRRVDPPFQKDASPRELVNSPATTARFRRRRPAGEALALTARR